MVISCLQKQTWKRHVYPSNSTSEDGLHRPDNSIEDLKTKTSFDQLSSNSSIDVGSRYGVSSRNIDNSRRRIVLSSVLGESDDGERLETGQAFQKGPRDLSNSMMGKGLTILKYFQSDYERRRRTSLDEYAAILEREAADLEEETFARRIYIQGLRDSRDFEKDSNRDDEHGHDDSERRLDLPTTLQKTTTRDRHMSPDISVNLETDHSDDSGPDTHSDRSSERPFCGISASKRTAGMNFSRNENNLNIPTAPTSTRPFFGMNPGQKWAGTKRSQSSTLDSDDESTYAPPSKRRHVGNQTDDHYIRMAGNRWRQLGSSKQNFPSITRAKTMEEKQRDHKKAQVNKKTRQTSTSSIISISSDSEASSGTLLRSSASGGRSNSAGQYIKPDSYDGPSISNGSATKQIPKISDETATSSIISTIEYLARKDNPPAISNTGYESGTHIPPAISVTDYSTGRYNPPYPHGYDNRTPQSNTGIVRKVLDSVLPGRLSRG